MALKAANKPDEPALTPIQQKLSGGDRKSVGLARSVALEVITQPELLHEIMDGLLVDDAILRSRCAHVAATIGIRDRRLLDPFKDFILSEAAWIPQWEVREQMSKIIPRLHLTDSDLRSVYSILDEYQNDRSSIVRTCALQARYDLLDRDPESRSRLVRELKEVASSGTAAMRARSRILLNELSQKFG